MPKKQGTQKIKKQRKTKAKLRSMVSPVGFAATLKMDIEERAEFLETILASSTEYSIVAEDLEGNIVAWNEGARRIYGWQPEEILGKSADILHINEDVKSGFVKNILNETLKNGKWTGTLTRQQKNGNLFTAYVTFTLRKDKKGNPIGYTMISRDISEQLRLEQRAMKLQQIESEAKQVQEASRLKSDFLANMSHELRTPLNAIIGFTELIRDEKVGHISSDQKEYLGDILTSSKHLLQLINDVLDLSKIEAGKMEFHPERISLQQVLSEITDILRTLVNQKRLTLTVTVDSSLEQTEIKIDPSRFKQVVYNYISNAIKFTPEGGAIEVRAISENKNFFRLEVEDNGIGIAAEDIDKLFIEFQQLDSGLSKKYSGTGLGLALTKKIVETQNGQVGVISAPKNGSTFFAVFPKQYQAPESPAVVPVVHQALNQTESILVIEDEDKDADWLSQTLQNEGYDVEIARTGQEAIKKCLHKQFSVITLDILLPDINGWTVLQKIKTGLNKATPVILLSIAANENQGLGHAFADRLVKPVAKEDLLIALKRAKNQRRLLRIFAIDRDQYSLKLLSKLVREEGFDLMTFKDMEKGMRSAILQKPDLLIVDLANSGKNSLEFLNQFKNQLSNIPLIIWTSKDLSKEEKNLLKQIKTIVIWKTVANSASILLKEIKEITNQSRTVYV